MANVSTKQDPPSIGSIVCLRGYPLRAMVVTDVSMDSRHRPYAVSVAWLDHADHPCHATYPLECLDMEGE